MAKFTVIEESSAPIVAKVAGENELLGQDILSQLSAGNVAKITPDENDTIRALKRGITTAANHAGKSVDMWVVDNVLYVKETEAVAKPKSKGTRKPKAKA